MDLRGLESHETTEWTVEIMGISVELDGERSSEERLTDRLSVRSSGLTSTLTVKEEGEDDMME